MILFLSAYPPRECGLASYSYQLIQALKEHYDTRSLSFEVCALERSQEEKRLYPDEVRYNLDTDDVKACEQVAHEINADASIKAVCIQHRFGFWGGERWGENILIFLKALQKPLAVVFHKVLPEPEQALQSLIDTVCQRADLLITPTRHQAEMLSQYYKVQQERMYVIPPAAAVVSPFNKAGLRKKHQLEGKLVLSTFGLLRRSKGIEHVLEALDSLRLDYPEVVFLILGKTHPAASHYEGERYRIQLKDLIFRKGLQKHVRFVNRDLKQEELQEFFCLSDIYIHTGTQSLNGLVLAQACGCQVIAPPLPVVEELLQGQVTLTNVQKSEAIAAAVAELARKGFCGEEVVQEAKPALYSYAWSDVAQAYQEVVSELVPMRMPYHLPALKADHLYRLTTSIGLQQTDQHAKPFASTGYLLRDNAKALVAALMWHRQEPQHELLLLMLIRRFLNVIRKCQQPDGSFLSQLDDQGDYVPEFDREQAQESSMQALWALSMLIKRHEHLPSDLPNLAQRLLNKALPHVGRLSSLPAIAYAISALSQYNEVHHSELITAKIDRLASQLQQAYDNAATVEWPWFERELRPASCLLPKALLLAWQACGQLSYKNTALRSFSFLLPRLFVATEATEKNELGLALMKKERFALADDPLAVYYAVQMLDLFYQHTRDQDYIDKMYAAFSWFMGNNEFNLSLYNSVSGACYDGLRNGKLSQQQGAESLVSYLLARLILDKHNVQQQSQQAVGAERKFSIMRGVDVLPDRPSIASGQIKVIAN